MSDAPAISPEIQNLKDEVCKKGELRVFQDFPKKVAMLTESLKGPMFAVTEISQISAKTNIPSHVSNGELPGAKRKRSEDDDVDDMCTKLGKFKQIPLFTTEIPSNKRIEEIIDFLKPEIITTIDSCSDIKLWIQLMIPKIEDGNNFGVSIQEDILSEVTKAESDASTYMDQITRYFSSRAKMVSKLAKYPLLQDYRRALSEYDEKVFLSFRLILTELRNIYIVLYDVVHKNYEKLKKPRNINTTSLY